MEKKEKKLLEEKKKENRAFDRNIRCFCSERIAIQIEINGRRKKDDKGTKEC